MRNYHLPLRAALLCGAALLTAPQIAAAQEPVQGDAQAAQVDEIVVTGIRRANVAAIESKRAATNIVDVVSATDVRALPDLTIVEALRRIPGLSVLPAIDNEHPRDEASTPVIRGLGSSYNNVTIDGLTIASPGTPNGNLGSVTRGVRLDILPSSMISEIQVVKTFTADLDPNAIGGAVNLKTRSAFENSGAPFFTMEASIGRADDTDKPRDQDDYGVRLVATGSATFGADDRFGVVVSANYQSLSSFTETHMTTDTVHYGFYNDAGVLQTGANLGNGRAVPQQDKYWYVMDKRDRYGLTGKLEARLSENVTGFVTGGYYYFKDDMERNELLFDPRNRGQVTGQTATSGSYPAGAIEVGYASQQLTSKTKVVQTGFDWTPSDRQRLSVRGSYSLATYDEPIQMIKYITGVGRNAPGPGGTTVTALPAYAFTYDTSNFNHKFAVSPDAYYNLANYSLFYWRPDYKRTAEDEIWTGRADYGFNQGRDAEGFGFAMGASYTNDKPLYNIDRTEYAPNTTAPTLGLAEALGPTGSPLKYTNGLYLLTIDPGKANGILNALPKSVFNRTDQTNFNNQDDFTHEEKTSGAYALATWRNEKLSAQGGLRLERTEQETVGRARRNGVWQNNATNSDYDFVLPSAILTYHLTPSIDLRAAASQTIGRPPYDAYAARSAINFVNSADIGNPNATGVTVTIGNPAIEPRLSTNLDLAVDWRIPGPSGGGILSAALFDKDIKDEIFTLSSLGYSDPASGVTYVNALVSRPANASKARIRGIELNAVMNSFGFVSPWLDGVGASANVALLDGELKVPTTTGGRTIDRLVGQPDNTINGTLFYSKKGLELRAAYNRQGKALRSVVDNIAWQDLYWDAREQLDLSATWAVNSQWSMIGQVSNITGERMTSLTGPNKNLLKDSYSVPTTFWLGFRWTPGL